MTVLYKVVHDTYDEMPTVRAEGQGEIPGAPIQAENFANDEWTAWYANTVEVPAEVLALL